MSPRPRSAPRQTVKCEICQKEFTERVSKHRRFCSRKCGDRAAVKRYRANRVDRTCDECGKEYVVRPALKDSRFCSQLCHNRRISRETAAARSVALAGRGKGPDGTVKKTTYLKLHSRHMHRVVKEQSLGRPLEAGEIVHHIDGDQHNNAPGNLQVMTQAEHAKLHSTKNRLCSIAGCGRKHAAKGFCAKHWRQWRKGKLMVA